MNGNENRYLGENPVGSPMRKYAIPCIISLLVGALYNIVDQISLVAAMAAINNMIRKYGAMDAIFGQEQYAQIPMAVVGIVMKFFQIVISIVVGMAAGCIPIVGYNMGAGLKVRVKNSLQRFRLRRHLLVQLILSLWRYSHRDLSESLVLQTRVLIIRNLQ